MGDYRTITIERQYGSGGRQIGKLVAEKLDFKFYNEEILKLAAENLHIPAEYMKEAEEAASSSFLYALTMATTPQGFTVNQQLTDKLFIEESVIIKKLAANENCVIVGRCAGRILSSKTDCLKIFIYSDEAERIKRATEEYGETAKNIKSILDKNDRRRARFYNSYSTNKWDDRDTYDICINSSKLGITNCVTLIASLF